MNPEILLIFDMDFTLIDMSPVDFSEVLSNALKQSGGSVPSREEFDALWKSGSKHSDILRGWGIKDAVAFWKVFDECDYKTRMGFVNAGKIAPYPDTRRVLDRFRRNSRFTLALHTNTSERLTRAQLDRFQLARFFDYILAIGMGEYDQAKAKPEPWGIYHIINAMNERFRVDFHDSVVFIGDSVVDMIAATSAGVPAIQLVRPGRVPSALATLNIKELDLLDAGLIDTILLKRKDIKEGKN
ncbi:MAG: HAD family hydrolase [Promethearchaeota archaeon]